MVVLKENLYGTVKGPLPAYGTRTTPQLQSVGVHFPNVWTFRVPPVCVILMRVMPSELPSTFVQFLTKLSSEATAGVGVAAVAGLTGATVAAAAVAVAAGASTSGLGSAE